MPKNLPEQILQRIVRLSADDNAQQEVARMLGVSLGCISKIVRRNRETDWLTTSEEAWRFDENLHATGRPSTASNGQNELLHRGSSSANADDPPSWEADVSSNHQETASGRWILVSVSSQMSLAHFGAHATPPYVGEEAQSMGPQTMETLYLQWWVPVLRIPQWRSSPGAPEARGQAEWWLRPA